ncbi:AIG1 family-domain-containing protein [Jimgerdemannia flammicorona]|uniref:AIG1 family-domain-containing protein n=1 Tax=Jimgerdemannia flammicorona TaxID=994334 RepID=A0A433A099_9FUNG|nr:AIG1 family-domain-containing protein [Jimgerdemannia flammicorona]
MLNELPGQPSFLSPLYTPRPSDGTVRRPPRVSPKFDDDTDTTFHRRRDDDDDDDALQIMTLGKSGEGKSSLLNAILGDDAFQAKISVSEVTKAVESHSGRWLGRPEHTAVKCVDTPTLAGQLGDRARVAQIGNLLEACLNGVDAFLIVTKVTHYRYDSSIHATLKVYETILNPSFWQNAILVFSHADPETATSWSDSQRHFDDFAAQIAKQFKLTTPPPICFASDRRSFGKTSATAGGIGNMGARGEIIVHDGTRICTIEPPARTLYERIREFHTRPYFPTHLTQYLHQNPRRTVADFAERLMTAVEQLDEFREVDRSAHKRSLSAALSPRPSLSSQIYGMGSNPSMASSIASLSGASSGASSATSSATTSVISSSAKCRVPWEGRNRPRAVSAESSPTPSESGSDHGGGGGSGRVTMTAMAGLLQLPNRLRRSSSAVTLRAKGLKRSSTYLPASTSVGV